MVSRNHPFEVFRLVFGEGAGIFFEKMGRSWTFSQNSRWHDFGLTIFLLTYSLSR